jgi:hypothetical protein
MPRGNAGVTETACTYPGLDLKSARELGAKALRAAAAGRDPGQEKAQTRAERSDSIEHNAAQFIQRHCKRTNRPRTAQETERLLRMHVLPRWRSRRVQEISRRDVLDVLDRVIDNGTPIAANRVFSAIRKFFNWCVQRDIVAASPCAGVKPPTAERSRNRVLVALSSRPMKTRHGVSKMRPEFIVLEWRQLGGGGSGSLKDVSRPRVEHRTAAEQQQPDDCAGLQPVEPVSVEEELNDEVPF